MKKLVAALALVLLVGCGSSELPVSVGPTPLAGPGASGLALIASTTSALVITYAQGTEHGLEVQWTGPATYLEVWYSRYGEDVDTLIAAMGWDPVKDGNFLPYRPKPEHFGGRYRVTVNGVTSRLMFLDGQEGGTSNPGPPVVTPPPSTPTPPTPPTKPDHPAPPKPPKDDDAACKRTGSSDCNKEREK